MWSYEVDGEPHLHHTCVHVYTVISQPANSTQADGLEVKTVPMFVLNHLQTVKTDTCQQYTNTSLVPTPVFVAHSTNVGEGLVKLITCNDVPGRVEEWDIPRKTIK